MKRAMRVVLTLAVACGAADRALGFGPGDAERERGDAFTCTEVIGVSVTGDWFGAGFEDGLDANRWQVRWRSKAFVDLWADPAHELWSLPLQSACTERSQDPDRVIFTAVNWEYKTREAWEQTLNAAVATFRSRYPGLRRIVLLTMLRAPGNQSCGSEMTVVQPYVDEAVANVVARHPGLVIAGPRVEAPNCDIFTKGGPHFTDAGKAAVAGLYRTALGGR
jgi:hypothetical protein